MENIPQVLQNIIVNYMGNNPIYSRVLLFPKVNFNTYIEQEWQKLLLTYPQFPNLFTLIQTLAQNEDLITYGSEFFTDSIHKLIFTQKIKDVKMFVYFHNIFNHSLPDKIYATSKNIPMSEVNNYNFYNKLINAEKISFDFEYEIYNKVIIEDVIYTLSFKSHVNENEDYNLIISWIFEQLQYMKCTEFGITFGYLKIPDIEYYIYRKKYKHPPKVITFICDEFNDLRYIEPLFLMDIKMVEINTLLSTFNNSLSLQYISELINNMINEVIDKLKDTHIKIIKYKHKIIYRDTPYDLIVDNIEDIFNNIVIQLNEIGITLVQY